MAYDAAWYRQKTTTVEGRVNILYHRARARAKKKGIEFDLSEDWIADQVEAQGNACKKTGIMFVYDEVLSPWQPSLDRIDAAGGYTRGNVQVVCLMYNQTKALATDEQVKIFADAVNKWA